MMHNKKPVRCKQFEAFILITIDILFILGGEIIKYIREKPKREELRRIKNFGKDKRGLKK